MVVRSRSIGERHRDAGIGEDERGRTPSRPASHDDDAEVGHAHVSIGGSRVC
jgi:hypothetical protein